MLVERNDVDAIATALESMTSKVRPTRQAGPLPSTSAYSVQVDGIHTSVSVRRRVKRGQTASTTLAVEQHFTNAGSSTLLVYVRIYGNIWADLPFFHVLIH